MATFATLPALVSVDEYLRTSYEPDVDYVDGYLEDRNVGENQHSDIQGELNFLFRLKGKEWDVYCFVEQREQVSKTRYRVPDVCVMPRSWKKTPIIREAPLLCIEVLSPEDRYSRTLTKCKDYFAMGVPEVWIFDPETRVVTVAHEGSSVEQSAGTLKLAGTAVEISIDAVFAVLDE
jgi:Uma2 family endonuclease